MFIWVVFGVFLGSKLTGAIDWSWWAVTAPLWIYAGIWLTARFIFEFIKALVKEFRSPKVQVITNARRPRRR